MPYSLVPELVPSEAPVHGAYVGVLRPSSVWGQPTIEALEWFLGHDCHAVVVDFDVNPNSLRYTLRGAQGERLAPRVVQLLASGGIRSSTMGRFEALHLAAVVNLGVRTLLCDRKREAPDGFPVLVSPIEPITARPR
ncbi:MAG TPA: hypothetical protein VMT30_04495 [Candidatus Saccharimonadia bacterium]|nr:hypothetical protein [Candidatus Saccharimonadia bacterium]